MPIVTISRQFGSGGSEVAARVAGALGWTLLDNALVDAVAEQLGTTPQAVEAREERVPSLAERLATAMTLGTPEFVPAIGVTPPPPFEDRIVEVTRRVVQRAAAEAPVVVVGRGAQSMLAERSDALHVLCYAPRHALVERVASREGISAAEAARIVDDTNHQREQYVRRHWHRSWLAHEHYHLCLNTAWLGIDAAADLVVRLARGRFGASAEA
ncbi:MAG: AAA family ATPase [Gemmatimonadaceae bacterium]